MAASTAVAVLAIIPLLPLLFVLLLRLSLRCLGWHLQAKTRARREAICDQVRRDQAALHEKLQAFPETEDGWEKIEKVGTAPNGEVLPDDWAGVVGFFHPFWYVTPTFRSLLPADLCLATLEEVANVSFGLPSPRLRDGGPMRYVPSTRATTTSTGPSSSPR